MTLESDAKSVAVDFDRVSSEHVLNVLDAIVPLLRNQHTSEYLKKKLDAARDEANESQRKTKCKALLPYIHWYIQGLDAR